MTHLIAKTRSPTIMAVPLHELHCHAKIENSVFLDKVADSIERFGLQNPVILLPMTIGRWLELKSYNPDILDPPEGLPQQEVLQVRCGNNRVRAANALGYETIDCIVARSLKEASSLCYNQREQQNRWTRENTFGDWNK